MYFKVVGSVFDGHDRGLVAQSWNPSFRFYSLDISSIHLDLQVSLRTFVRRWQTNQAERGVDDARLTGRLSLEE